ncbi:MmpS family transport accessory protein [Corynebacterium mastitidis]
MTTPDPTQQPQPQVVYVKEEKKPWYKKPGCMVPLILIILALVGFVGCTALVGKGIDEVDKDLNAEYTITYMIEGDAQNALATYNVGESETAQDNGVAAGWEKEVTVTGIFGGYLSATNGIEDEGTITCKIIKDGEVITENTATGLGATASCNAGSDELK